MHLAGYISTCWCLMSLFTSARTHTPTPRRVRVYLFRARAAAYIISTPIALHPSHFSIRATSGSSPPPPPDPPPPSDARERAEFSPGTHAERRATEKCAGYIKGKIFLCPVIGGCHSNTRATSASNYFQTLRIERAPPASRRNSPTHTHIFPYLPVALSHLYHSPTSSPPIFLSPSAGGTTFLPHCPLSRLRECWLLMVEVWEDWECTCVNMRERERRGGKKRKKSRRGGGEGELNTRKIHRSTLED